MIQKVFNRYEKKYLLDQKTYEVFKKELDVYMAEDSTSAIYTSSSFLKTSYVF